jgi:hypothetical protein
MFLMNSITSGAILLLVIGAWLALGFKPRLNHFSKRAIEKRKAERAAVFKARRDERNDQRPTMVEALKSRARYNASACGAGR